jgi:hypothetical protein
MEAFELVNNLDGKVLGALVDQGGILSVLQWQGHYLVKNLIFTVVV